MTTPEKLNEIIAVYFQDSWPNITVEIITLYHTIAAFNDPVQDAF